jgi:hypothetical protein
MGKRPAPVGGELVSPLGGPEGETWSNLFPNIRLGVQSVNPELCFFGGMSTFTLSRGRWMVVAVLDGGFKKHRGLAGGACFEPSYV